MKQQKAQINQVFIWIMAILLIGVIALMGTKSIGGLMSDKCSIDYIRFQAKTSDSISSKNDFGSINAVDITAPCSYAQVCFVDTRSIENEAELDNGDPDNDDDDVPSSLYEFIKDSVKDGAEYNVFLFDGKYARTAGFINQIRLDNTRTSEYTGNNFTCVKAKSGRFSLILEGLGKNTLVQPK